MNVYELDRIKFQLLDLARRRGINLKYLDLSKTKIKNIYYAYVSDLKTNGETPRVSNDVLSTPSYKIVARIKRATGYDALEIELVLTTISNGFQNGIFNLSLIDPINAKKIKKDVGSIIPTIPFIDSETSSKIEKTTKTLTIIAGIAVTGYLLNQISKLRFW